jgi:hypothetical protein
VTHVTQLETELTSIIGRQIMAKIHTYPIHNVGTIDDFLHVKVKYLDNLDNSKQIYKIPTVLSVPQENQEKSVNFYDGIMPRGTRYKQMNIKRGENSKTSK